MSGARAQPDLLSELWGGALHGHFNKRPADSHATQVWESRPGRKCPQKRRGMNVPGSPQFEKRYAPQRVNCVSIHSPPRPHPQSSLGLGQGNCPGDGAGVTDATAAGFQAWTARGFRLPPPPGEPHVPDSEQKDTESAPGHTPKPQPTQTRVQDIKVCESLSARLLLIQHHHSKS